MARPNQILNELGEISKAGCVLVKGNKVLFILTKDNYAYLPKGHVEQGESLLATAKRETKEETGYDVEVVEQLGDVSYNNGETGEPIRVTYFLARPLQKTGEPEGKLAWMDIEQSAGLSRPNVTEFLRVHRAQIEQI